MEPKTSERNGRVQGMAPERKHLFGGGSGFSDSRDLNTMFRALAGIQLPPIIRAQNPFDNHPWIFAAAVSIATVASQAPFTIFRETEEAEAAKLRVHEKRYGRSWRHSRGAHRRAIQRYSALSSAKRLFQKHLEEDFDHPASQAFLKPNPYQCGNQLFWTTQLWLALRGQCFWVLEGDNEDGVFDPEEEVSRIWPMSPDLFRPVLENGQYGELVQWEFRPPNFMRGTEQGTRVFLELEQVLEFKQAHPQNMLQGISREAVLAQGVNQDLNLKEYNQSIVENDGDPGGVVMYDTQMQEEERQEWLQKWEQRHVGTKNKNKTALLDAGFKYMPIAMTPVELQGQAQLEWNRAEHLAVMGTPPSVLGVTEFVNYATDLGQKRNFWEHTIIPMLKLIEETIDGSTIFFEEPDNVVGLFNLKNVEALRSGLMEKVEVAQAMCGQELHMPPSVAYETLGLEISDYDGIDVGLITPLATSVEDVLSSADDPELDAGLPQPEIDPEVDEGEGSEDEGEEDEADEKGLSQAQSTIEKGQGGSRWKAFVAIQEPHEKIFGRRYRRWVNAERRETLARFDDAVKVRIEELETRGWDPVVKQSPEVNLTEILPELTNSQNGLRLRIRPVYASMLDTTFNFTLADLGGIPVFGIDAPSIFDVFQSRENNLVLNTPDTVRRNLLKTLTDGIALGEDIQALRQRIAEVYKISASDAKTLQIARTETAGFMNETREAMFKEQGFEKLEWITAGDEHVRENHQVYGNAGPTDSGFNYLTFVGKRGTLEFPGDSRAPADEVINCRCMKVPAK